MIPSCISSWRDYCPQGISCLAPLPGHPISFDPGAGAAQDAGEQLFSTTEVSLLLPLLEQYPHYCPYEVLWASFHGSTSEIAIVRARNRLQRAREEGYWDEEMRPLRIMLSRARLKLQEMGPDIVSLFETGYLPTRHDRRRLRRKTDETGGERDAPR
jgi:hypothetical protein